MDNPVAWLKLGRVIPLDCKLDSRYSLFLSPIVSQNVVRNSMWEILISDHEVNEFPRKIGTSEENQELRMLLSQKKIRLASPDLGSFLSLLRSLDGCS